MTAVDLYRLKKGGLGIGSAPGQVGSESTDRCSAKKAALTSPYRLDEYETCALWDRKAGLCSVYASRPLICRTHICAPLSWRAAEVRAQIVNAGEDELVRMLGLLTGIARAVSCSPLWER